MAKFWTKRGLKILGKLVKQAREAQGWSQRSLGELIEKKHQGRYSVTHATVSKLESGIYDNPRHNTIVAIASLRFVSNPLTGQPFTEDELSDIAAERLDPKTGKYKLGSEQPTLADLIEIEIKNRPQSSKGLALKKLATDAQLEIDRLEAILAGQIPTEEELTKLAQVLTKQDGTHWQELELRIIFEKEYLSDPSY